MFRIETFQFDSIKTINEMTKEYARKVLEMVDGNKTKAAQLLGVSELDFYRIISEK